MQAEHFEWDDHKAQTNFRDHNVTFEEAMLAFEDPDGIDEIESSMHYGEERWKLIGVAEGKVLVVIHTPRENRTRIISARKAERHEREDYHRQSR